MAWKEYPLIGFAPDLPNTTPGSIIRSQFAVPTDRGIGNGPRISEDSTALNSASLGGCDVYKTDYTRRYFAATATKIYELNVPTPTTPTDRSGATYNASTSQTWAFGQFGDVTLAVNKGDILQACTTGSFAAVGIAPVPKASVMAIGGPPSSPFVAVFDFDDGTNNYRDGWFISAQADYTGWTAGTNNCAKGRLTDDSPGPIVAAIGYRDGFLAWKRNAMYRGTFIGPPDVWAWERISNDIGCVGKNCVTRANDVVYWGDDSAIWQFDGSYPKKVKGDVHNYWALHTTALIAASETNRNFFRCLWDKSKHLLWALFCYSADQGPTAQGADNTIMGVTWNAISNIWVQQFRNPFENVAQTIWAVEIIAPRLIVTNNKKVGLVSWTPDATWGPRLPILTAWVFSDHRTQFTIKDLRPFWATDDTSVNATARVIAYNSQAVLTPEAITGGGSFTYADCSFRVPGKFDGQINGENVSFEINPTPGTAWEILAVGMDVTPLGKQ